MRQPLFGFSPGSVLTLAAALVTAALLAWMVSFSDGPTNLFVDRGASAAFVHAH
jgi:hypothetical protein